MKNEIAFLVSTNIKSIFRNLNNEKFLIDELNSNNKKIKIIDLSKYSKINNKNYIKKLNQTYGNLFELEIVKNLKTLDTLNNNKKITFINLVPIEFNQFKVWRIIKKKNLFNVFVQNNQFRNLREQENFNGTIKKNIIKNFLKFYYLFRILVILNYFPKVDVVFVATKKIKKKFEKNIFKKLDNFFKINLFSFFKKIKIVNIKFYKPRIVTKSRYICFLDTAPFDHPSLKSFSKEKVNQSERKIFYYNLRLSIKKIQNHLKKKVIICLHPKYNFKYKKSDFGNLRCKLFNTSKYINESELVLFTSSSMIVNAMLLKKKIIQINSLTLPAYFKSENLHWNSLFNFSSILVDRPNKLDHGYLSNLIKNSKNKIKRYNKIVKKIVHKNNLSGSMQIIKILESENI